MFNLFIFSIGVFLTNYAIRIYRQYYHDHVKWATGDRFTKTQKMTFDTFSKTYFMSKQFLYIDNPDKVKIILKVPRECRTPYEDHYTNYRLLFSFFDYFKVKKFLKDTKKETIEDSYQHPEVYEFLQQLCQAEMKKAQKTVEVACDDIKKITLRINGEEEDK